MFVPECGPDGRWDAGLQPLVSRASQSSERFRVSRAARRTFNLAQASPSTIGSFYKMLEAAVTGLQPMQA